MGWKDWVIGIVSAGEVITHIVTGGPSLSDQLGNSYSKDKEQQISQEIEGATNPSKD